MTKVKHGTAGNDFMNDTKYCNSNICIAKKVQWPKLSAIARLKVLWPLLYTGGIAMVSESTS